MQSRTISLLGPSKPFNGVSAKKKVKRADRETEERRTKLRKKKKKMEVEEDAPVKKKKKSQALAELPIQGEGPALTKEEKIKLKKIAKRTKLLRGTFKDSVPRIHQLISDDNIPAAMAMAQRGFIVMLTELIPILEQTVRDKPGQSSVYSLNALVSQVRELQADMKAEGDQASLAQRIADEVITRSIMELSQRMATSLYHIKEQLRPYIKDTAINSFDQTYNKSMMDIGDYVNEAQGRMIEKIMAMMILE